ncbi:hypothetical protein [Anabaena sp. PCC 7108]|uniref:hypothetical protein n=1 Tax=Anabaena sp. PCC 7108 TaxID=163908 RepID=UPI00036FCD45|nr:hypothetical protein [Anabaena sp. PCC 7108]
MPKTLIVDVIMQQLDALSVEELLEVRAKVDALIQVKSPSLANYLNSNSYSTETRGIFTRTLLSTLIPSSSIKGHIKYSLITGSQESNSIEKTLLQFAHEYLVQGIELKERKDDSLEKIIDMVDGWMADESDYDQEAYPQIEAALNKNRLSR